MTYLSLGRQHGTSDVASTHDDLAAAAQKDKITALQSASVVVDYVLDIFPVNSVVDIGCGPGFWLKTFADRGVRRIAGIDGGYTDRARLAIDPPVSLAVI